MTLAATEMHELGHSFHIGEADDDGPLPLQEVYSGDADDDTKENLDTLSTTEWSLMREGWAPEALFTHNGASYHVFSLEELSSITLPR